MPITTLQLVRLGWQLLLPAAVLSMLLTSPALAQDPAVLVEDGQLISRGGPFDDSFGSAVTIRDDVMLVGAHDPVPAGPGSVFAFVRDGRSWVVQKELRASDGEAFDFFGGSIAYDAGTALVGVRGDDDNGSMSGSAYVFRRNGDSWHEKQKLLPDAVAAGDRFGQAVALSDAVAVVGAWGDDDNGEDAGAAYVFRFNGTGWFEEQKLIASDGAAGDAFGLGVAASGDTVFVTAPQADASGSDSGTVYVFRWNGASWLEEQVLRAGDAAAGDFFGSTIAVRDDTTLIGAPGADDNGASSGSAYVFRRDGTSWVEQQELLPSVGAPADRFGDGVAVAADDTVLVGAWLGDGAAGDDVGSAHRFRWNGSSWIEDQVLFASDAAPEDAFGTSVAIDGATAVIGAPATLESGGIAGSAYVFSLPQPWATLGDGLAGTGGVAPVLSGLGPLTAGSLNQLELADALPGSTATLVVGFSVGDLPFGGGVLVPAPDLLITGLPLDADGAASLPFTWPAEVVPGTSLFLQAWVVDAGAAAGFSASDALEAQSQ